MKTVGCILLVLTLTSFKVDEPSEDINETVKYILKPGIGINNIKLNKSSVAFIKRHAGADLQIIGGISTGRFMKGYIGPRNIRWKRITNKTTGVEFELNSRWFYRPLYPLKLHLEEIIIKDNPSASLENGITILKSTFDEVIEVYGAQSIEFSTSTVYSYPEHGVGFMFNEDKVLRYVTIYPVYEAINKR